MNSFRFLAVAALSVFLFQTAPLLASPPDTNAPANYVIKVLMKDAKGNDSSLQVTTMAGPFELDTIQKNSVKINNADIPTTLKVNGTLTAVSEQKGVLKFFLGHTVPYVTSTYNNGSSTGMASSYSQLSVGLDASFVVTYGTPLIVQSDDSGKVTILVTRGEN